MNRPAVWLLHNIDSAWTPQEAADIRQELDLMIDSLREAGHLVEPLEVRRDALAPLRGRDPGEGVVFNWCEGLDGEPKAYDKVARALETTRFAFTGSGSWTLARSQVKADSKALLDQAGVPTPRWRVFSGATGAGAWPIYPAIVKPVAEHASEGISLESVVDDPAALRRQIEAVMDRYGVGALVEEFIDGREVYASIWGNRTPEVLPLHEIEFVGLDDPRERIIDFEAKWQTDSYRYTHSPERCPANLDEPTADRVRAAAVAAYRALRCRDYGRIDLRVRDGVPYVVDVNPNCDITRDNGGFYMAAHAAGYEYGAMASRIVQCAADRVPRENGTRINTDGADESPVRVQT